METVVVTEERVPSGGTSAWWVFLLMGIGWVIVSLIVLSFDPTSAAAIGWMTAAVLIVAGLDEGFAALTAPGWRWLHAVLGLVLFTLGVGALLDPFQTFGILALLSEIDAGDFNYLRDTLELTNGNLNSHLQTPRRRLHHHHRVCSSCAIARRPAGVAVTVVREPRPRPVY